MTFGQDETVVVVVVRVLRIILHMTEKQGRHDIGRRAARSRVSAASRSGGFNGMDAQLIGNPLQQFNIRFNHICYWRSLNEEAGKPRLKSGPAAQMAW